VWNKQQTSNRAAWGTYCSPLSPSFPSPFEYILIFAKETKSLQGRGETDLTAEEFKEWAYGIWTFPPETRQKKFGHPAMFPYELPKRAIKMLSWVGATVLDPFNGAGTTTLAASNLGRDAIGFDISADYCKTAINRKEL
jgi:site-specific DNA-methyltransferase (adenine-specific)